MDRLVESGNDSLWIKALVVEKHFFSTVDKLDEQALHESIPTLVELLHEYDRLLWFPRHSDFTTALDVRLFYLAFDLLKKANPQTRQYMLHGIGVVFRKGQLDAIGRAQLRLIEGGREETKPVALLPLLRVV